MAPIAKIYFNEIQDAADLIRLNELMMDMAFDRSLDEEDYIELHAAIVKRGREISGNEKLTLLEI